MSFLDDENGLGESPSQFNDEKKYYICSECPSPIEILSISGKEYTIEFKCVNNNHQIKTSLKDYVNKMKQYNENEINELNNDNCKEHNKVYKIYCIDCKKHLCLDCLKSRKHVGHLKNSIVEILPNETIL